MSRQRAATNPGTSMLLALSSWLGIRPATSPRPMLLRVGGSAPRTVEVSAHWSIGGGRKVTTTRLYVSDGVCLLAWAPDARSVEIEVRLPEGSRHIEVDRDRYVGEVLELSRA